MKLLGKTLAITAAAFALSVGTQSTFAQGQRGNFDPAEMRQRMETRMRELFDVKDDGEWKLIYERVEKVNEARRGTGGMGGGMGMLMRRPGGDQGGGDNNGGGGRRGGFGGGGTPDPDQEALQKAIEAKAPAEEIKAKLAKVREARKAAEAKLEAAQGELKKVLSVRQEAVAVMLGLLK